MPSSASLLQFLKDYPFFATVLTTTVVAIVSIFVTLRLQKRGAIEWSVFSVEAFTAAHAIKSDLEVSYKGQPISSLWTSVFFLRNVGNIEIEEADFVDPLTLSVDGQVMIHRLSDEKNKTNVIWLEPLDPEQTRECLFTVRLLRPGEVIRVTLLTFDKPQVHAVSARIKGVSKLRRVPFISPPWLPVLALVPMLIGATWQAKIEPASMDLSLGPGIMLLISIIVLLIGVLRWFGRPSSILRRQFRRMLQEPGRWQ